MTSLSDGPIVSDGEPTFQHIRQQVEQTWAEMNEEECIARYGRQHRSYDFLDTKLRHVTTSSIPANWEEAKTQAVIMDTLFTDGDRTPADRHIKYIIGNRYKDGKPVTYTETYDYVTKTFVPF